MPSPEDVERIAAGLPKTVSDRDRADREDLRHVPFTTIDPETARDFDDAVAVESLPGGARGCGSPWRTSRTTCAKARPSMPRRGNAAVAFTFPTGPSPCCRSRCRRTCARWCPRKTGWRWSRGSILIATPRSPETEFSAAVIHSRARLDYPGGGGGAGRRHAGQAQEVRTIPAGAAADGFAGAAASGQAPRTGVVGLRSARALCRAGPRRSPSGARHSEGAPRSGRAPGVFDDRGVHAGRERGGGRQFRERREDAVWRIHDAPDAGRLEQFAILAAHYGITIDVDEARTPRGLRRVLEKLRGHAAEKPLSFALLRSLKQATYDVVNVGHFGLASRDYLHFTSPIRRYPDLIVHRLLKVRLAGQGKPSGGWKPADVQAPPDRTELQRMASDASFAERSAMEAEREVIDIYRAYFMRDRIGDVFEGTISGVMGFGVFVIKLSKKYLGSQKK